MTFPKHKYWDFYVKWKESPSYSPVLHEIIYVTRRGWDHIAGKSKRRSFKDVVRRLKLLMYAKRVIESEKCEVLIEASTNFIIFSQKIKIRGEIKELRVIAIRDKSLRLIFLSVMDRKIGVSHTSASKA